MELIDYNSYILPDGHYDWEAANRIYLELRLWERANGLWMETWN